MNEINNKQNEASSIDKLSAQKQLYSDAKNWLGTYLFLSIPLLMILSLVVKPILINDFFNLGWTYDITDSVALFALVLAFYESLFLKRYITKMKLNAAKIQEQFDCYIYNMPWNNAICGDRIGDAEVSKYSSKYSRRGGSRADFNDWYSKEVEQEEHKKAISLCQNENLGWDIEQRSKFNQILIFVSLIFVISSVIVGFYLEFSVKSLILSVIIPCWPALNYAIANYFDNSDAIKDKKALKSLLTQAVNSRAITDKKLRSTQDTLYLNRKNNALIFDWFYKRYQNKNQQDISYESNQNINN